METCTDTNQQSSPPPTPPPTSNLAGQMFNPASGKEKEVRVETGESDIPEHLRGMITASKVDEATLQRFFSEREVTRGEIRWAICDAEDATILSTLFELNKFSDHSFPHMLYFVLAYWTNPSVRGEDLLKEAYESFHTGHGALLNRIVTHTCLAVDGNVDQLANVQGDLKEGQVSRVILTGLMISCIQEMKNMTPIVSETPNEIEISALNRTITMLCRLNNLMYIFKGEVRLLYYNAMKDVFTQLDGAMQKSSDRVRKDAWLSFKGPQYFEDAMARITVTQQEDIACRELTFTHQEFNSAFLPLRRLVDAIEGNKFTVEQCEALFVALNIPERKKIVCDITIVELFSRKDDTVTVCGDAIDKCSDVEHDWEEVLDYMMQHPVEITKSDPICQALLARAKDSLKALEQPTAEVLW